MLTSTRDSLRNNGKRKGQERHEGNEGNVPCPVIFEQRLGDWAQRIQSLITGLHKLFIGTDNDDRQKISESMKESRDHVR